MCISMRTPRLAVAIAGLLAAIWALNGCSKSDEAKAAQATASPTPVAAPPAPQGNPPAPTADAKEWTPIALDELLAPIALYPDPVLAQVLAASTTSQEVLDAGNWLLDQQDLKGDDLTKAASEAGFTPTLQALVHFPTVVDMMCRELDWTKQLGAAFNADQAAVLASVQRLRAQAADVGNLKTSPEMTVTKTEQNGQSVIIVQPPTPQVVYVPQYNPQTVYTAPPPTTTTTTTSSDSGISTNEAVVGGLLAFGAGLLIGNAINDNNDDYCYPNWGHGGVYYGGRPYYPGNTFVYAPRYGAGHRPTPYYRAQGNYANRNNNNNYNRNTNINVNNNNNYMNRFDGNRNRSSTYQPRSPIKSPAAGDRSSSRGSSTYAGADRARPSTQPANRPSTQPSQGYAGRDNRPGQGGQGAANGTYRGSSQGGQPRATNNAQRPSTGVDRGYPKTSGNRSDVGATNTRGGSFSGVNQGAADRAASDRGRGSMKEAARPSTTQRAARGGGGGGRSGGGGGGGRGGRG